MRREFVCEECDWIGSPEIEPDECPRCGGPHIFPTGFDTEGDPA